MQAMMGAPSGGAGYEFTPAEDQAISRTGDRAKTWGMISIVGGVLLALIGLAVAGAGIAVAKGDAQTLALAAAAGLLAFAVPPLVSGKFYRDAGAALRMVSDTRGNDIASMMSAIGKLKVAFQIEAIASIVGFVLGIVGGVVLAMQKG